MMRLFKQVASKAIVYCAPRREFSHLKFLIDPQPRIETIEPNFPPRPIISKNSSRYVDPVTRIHEVIELGQALNNTTDNLTDQLEITDPIVHALPYNQLVYERLLQEKLLSGFLEKMIDAVAKEKNPDLFARGVLNAIALHHQSSHLNEKLLKALVKNANTANLAPEDLRKVHLFFAPYRNKLGDSIKELDNLIISTTTKQLPSLDAESLPTALITYHDISKAQKSESLAQEFKKLLGAHSAKLTGGDQSLSGQAKIFYLGSLARQENELTKGSGSKVLGNLIELESEELVFAAEALESLNVKNEETWEDLELVVQSKIGQLNTQELSRIAVVIARRRPDSVRLLAILDQHIGLNFEQIYPQNVSQLLLAYAASGNYRDSFINLLREYYLQNISRFSPSEITHSVYALAITKRLDEDILLQSEAQLAIAENRTLATSELIHLLVALDSQCMYKSKTHELYAAQIEELIKKPVEAAYSESGVFVTPALVRLVASGNVKSELRAEFENSVESLLNEQPTQRNVQFTLHLLEALSRKDVSNFYGSKIVAKALQTAGKLAASAQTRSFEIEEIEYLAEILKIYQ